MEDSSANKNASSSSSVDSDIGFDISPARRRMGSPDYITYGVGALVAFGGVFGYAKVGSLMSLGSGLLFGSLILYGGYIHSVNRRDFLLAFLSSVVLCGVMGVRFFKTGKFMPAGLVLCVNLFQVIRFGYRFFMD